MRNKKSIIAALIGLAVILAVIGGRYIYSEYHTYYSPSAREYETITAEKGIFVLETQKKELLGSTYAAFLVKDRESGEVIYQCPDLYLVKELNGIQWLQSGDSAYDIEIQVNGKSPVIYRYHSENRDSWAKQQ